ncbi:MAG: SCO6745 family protein [Acidimicrobiales bacterium]
MTGAPRPPERRLADAFAPYHNLSYYCPEIAEFTAAGMRGWWMAYFACRSAPLGRVPAEVVTAAFYGFAPRMVHRAIPAVWAVMSPAEALARRLDVTDRALRRVLGEEVAGPAVAEAAALARRAVEGCELAGRPLFAGHCALEWPTAPHLVLFHACTLLREQRGDSHSLALAAHELDGVACHVMMAALGHGNRASILPIRGWTEAEWAAAQERLTARGWLSADGSLTEAGREGRAAVEALTDRLAAEPAARLGERGLDRFVELMTPLSEALHTRGGVPGSWPPPHLLRPA